MLDFRMQDVIAAMPVTDDQWLNMNEKEREEWEANANRRAQVNQHVVFGHDHKVVNGVPQEQGHGAKGPETLNHFNSIRRYESEEAYWAAVAEIHKRDPERAKKLGLPSPRPAGR